MPDRLMHNDKSAGTNPRYEFRVWGDELCTLYERLQHASAMQEIEYTTEIYILSDRGGCFNPKVRKGVFDAKKLLKTRRGLELWCPYVKARFPLSRSVIRDQLSSILLLDPQNVVRPFYEFDLFVRTIIDPSPHLTLVSVRKQRCRFTIGRCLGEFTDVLVKGKHVETVAVESPDSAATLRAAARLGLCDKPNLSYQDALRSLAGVTAAR